MKNFNVYFRNTVLLICLLSVILSCNQMSQGLQRRKFEFLYKLSNYAAIFKEYTYEITYYKDLDFYEVKMKKLYEDINNIETVKEWETSKVIKEKFLNTIDSNLQSINTFRQRMMPSGENIRKEYDILIMNDRADKFIEELNREISKVGKE